MLVRELPAFRLFLVDLKHTPTDTHTLTHTHTHTHTLTHSHSDTHTQTHTITHTVTRALLTLHRFISRLVTYYEVPCCRINKEVLSTVFLAPS